MKPSFSPYYYYYYYYHILFIYFLFPFLLTKYLSFFVLKKLKYLSTHKDKVTATVVVNRELTQHSPSN